MAGFAKRKGLANVGKVSDSRLQISAKPQSNILFEMQFAPLHSALGIVVLQFDISQTAGSTHPNCMSIWRLSPCIHKLITFWLANISADFPK